MSQKETIAEDLISHHTQDEIDEYVRGALRAGCTSYTYVSGSVAAHEFTDGSKLYWSDKTEMWYAREEQAP